MIEVGLTGCMGSGKSSVAQRLRRLGAQVIGADKIVRELQEPGTAVFLGIVERFGEKVLAADGTLDRGALANIVFSDQDSLTDLNELVHPAVQDEMTRQRKALAKLSGVLILDVPLLVESNYEGLAGIIVVDVATELAIERLVANRGFSREDVRARLSKQASRQQRLDRADFVIDNNGSWQDLQAEIDKCWLWIQTLANADKSNPWGHHR